MWLRMKKRLKFIWKQVILKYLFCYIISKKLKSVVDGNIENHAFIVSPGRQKIPKGIETKERALWQQLIQSGDNKRKILELIHYVKVTKSDRYSNNGQIICSPKSPVQIPFQN